MSVIIQLTETIPLLYIFTMSVIFSILFRYKYTYIFYSHILILLRVLKKLYSPFIIYTNIKLQAPEESIQLQLFFYAQVFINAVNICLFI